jgi:hypothetical protein
MGLSAVRLDRLILAPGFVCLAAGSSILGANVGVTAAMNRQQAVITFAVRYQQG